VCLCVCVCTRVPVRKFSKRLADVHNISARFSRCRSGCDRDGRHWLAGVCVLPRACRGGGHRVRDLAGQGPRRRAGKGNRVTKHQFAMHTCPQPIFLHTAQSGAVRAATVTSSHSKLVQFIAPLLLHLARCSAVGDTSSSSLTLLLALGDARQ
jgi:hypothetical protein